MIVKMDKVTIIMYDNNRRLNIEKLKKLGLVHVRTAEVPDQSSESLVPEKKLIEKALSLFPSDKREKLSSRPTRIKSSFSINTAAEYSKRIIRRFEILSGMQESLKQLDNTISRLSLWGNFNPADLELIKKRGIELIPGAVEKKNVRKFENSQKAFFLGKHRNLFLYALVRQGEISPDIFFPLEIPEKPLFEYIRDRKSLLAEIKKISEEIKSLKNHKSFLSDSLEFIDENLEFNSVLNSLDKNEELALLTGFAPFGQRGKIKEFSDKAGWAVLFSEPSIEDNVPSLVRNKRAVGIIKPVFDLMGVVPGYRENDISFVFLISLSLFFSMIIGDAGYGLLIFITASAAAIVRLFRRKKITDAHFLLLLMSFTTIIWGSVTGTWFGSEKISGLPFIKDLVLRIFYVHDKNSNFNIILFSFVLGLIHLGIAHIWNIVKSIKNRSGLKILAQLGWFSIQLCAFYLVLNLVLSAEKFPLPDFIFPVIIAGLSLVIIFGNQQGNFLKSILRGFSGLITTILAAISSFSDIISYIRLYALGLASVEIAKSFNAIAESAGNTIYGVIGGAFILVIGHGLNLTMAGLSVFVHGLRLNMLEFSNHLGMEWSGVQYNPFRERV